VLRFGDRASAADGDREAKPLLLELDVMRRTLGNRHPHTLKCITNAAKLLWGQSKLAEVKPLFVEVVEVNRKTLANEHPDTLKRIHNLTSYGGIT